MALSRLAREFAAEIAVHDWSDAPHRADKAGHRREHDRDWENKPHMNEVQTENVRLNVMWVVGQVLGHAGLLSLDDVYEFAMACGCETKTPSGKPGSGHIRYGFRIRDGAFEPAPGRVPPLNKEVLRNIGPWDEIDYADDTPINVGNAAAIINVWLARHRVDKTLKAATFAKYAMNHIRDSFLSKDADGHDTWYVPLGALREWFTGYYQRYYSEHAGP